LSTRTTVLIVAAGALVVAAAVLSLLYLGPGSADADPSLYASRPALHATLNAASAVLVSLGYLCIRARRVRIHATLMVLASLTTLTFLVSYVEYHAHAGSVPFSGQGLVRPLYFALLISHTVLAAVVVPLVALVFVHAIGRRFDRHRRIARVALPIWLYVSVTGVLIYLFLYMWFPR